MKNLFILFLFCPLLVWGQNLVQAEYFFDEDPGYGKAIKMGFAPQETISLEANLYIELIPPGFHTLHYRFKDDTNGWGHTYTSHVFFGSEEANLQKAEYFFDRDPGYGKGIQLQFEDASTIALSAHLNFDMLEPGLHTFFYRLKSKNGWGTTLSHQVYKPAIPKICKIIYRFDTAPEEHIINL
ncbi:MAG: hypothetical protein PF444_02485, partial [Bacteroidales bacterium]|nr:hypothetical protein [Bacteroidales bacterium]